MICSNCVLDSTITNITFNDKGVCNYCEKYYQNTKNNDFKALEKELPDIIKKIKEDGKNKEYDCIIGLSGGVDSSYVAYLVKKFGLRPLAIHLDNGWDAEIAVDNITNICKTLNIDLFTYVIDWEEFRDLQKSFLKASVANAEIPTDHAIVACLYKLAKKHKIKYIIDGVNIATEFYRPGVANAGYTYGDVYHIKAIHKKFGTKKLKTFPTLTYLQKFLYKKVLGIKQVSILNYMDYKKEQAIEVLKSKLGWRSYGGKHHESIFTKFHQVIYLPEKFHFDKRRIHLSDLILSRQLSHAEAVDIINQPTISVQERKELIEYFKKKMQLNDAEFEEIMQSKPVSYKAYPNRDWILHAYHKYVKKIA